MIPDTDEELIAEAEKVGMIYGNDEDVLTCTSELRALINDYIAKDRAQGQEPVAWQDKFGDVVLDRWKKLYDESNAYNIPLFAHAQPIAEIQAEALEKAANSDWHRVRDLSYKEALLDMAAKLRKGESL